MMEHHCLPLENLHGKKLNGYKLHLGEVKQLLMSGWKGFTLYLQDSHTLLTRSPVIKGIFSIGGKHGIKPWMDVQYRENIEFPALAVGENTICLSSNSLDRMLFIYLGYCIPEGGHLMVSYEDGEEIHNDALRSLNLGMPPAVTALGYLLFLAGFQYIKNWYLSEGGYEGPRKLWAEKALNEAEASTFLERTASQIEKFLEKYRSPDYRALEEAARQRAREILEIIRQKLG